MLGNDSEKQNVLAIGRKKTSLCFVCNFVALWIYVDVDTEE